MHESEKSKWSRSVVSDSSRPHGLQPTRLLHPWDFPGKSTGVWCHCLLRHLYLVTCYSVSSLPEEFISSYTFFFLLHSFLPPFVSDIWSSFHASFCFFFNAEFSDFQMHSPGCLNNEINHKITRDIAGSLEIRPQQLWELQTWSHPGLLLHLWHPISHQVPSILFFNIAFFLIWT